MSHLIITVFLSLLVVIAALNRNDPCTTPNNERANCIPIKSCDIILNAVITRNQVAIDFAKRSKCGHDRDPLVCCGTSAYPQKFNINDLFATAIPGETTSTPFASKSSFLPDRTVCGIQTLADRIIGGTDTAIDEFPWMALLKYRNKLTDEIQFKCGGTLINNQYVLTAAHCVSGSATRDYTLFGVRLGEWDYSQNEDCHLGKTVRKCSEAVVDRRTEEIIPHAFYSQKRSTNDIALLRLDTPVAYTDYIRPICLPPMSMLAPRIGTNMTVAGWGVTDTMETLSTIKMKVNVPVRSNEECRKTFEMKAISSNQVCAGGEHQKDSCRGDSGGPLMYYFTDVQKEEKQWYQEGIVSFGTVVCGIESKPAVYTRIAPYMNWILSNLRD